MDAVLGENWKLNLTGCFAESGRSTPPSQITKGSLEVENAIYSTLDGMT
jgi:hypothetical protein